MRAIVPTIYGDAAMASLRSKLEVAIPNTNMFLDSAIQQQAPITAVPSFSNFLPTMTQYTTGTNEINNLKSAYFVIGVGGHKLMQSSFGTNTPPYFQPIPHSSIDAAPYSWIPFKLIPDTGTSTVDISGQERENYVMRRLCTINGKNYIGYWIKRVPITSVPPIPAYSTYAITGGVQQPTSPWLPPTSVMTPSNANIANGVQPSTGQYFEAAISTSVTFNNGTVAGTFNEIADLQNVGQIMFGDPNAIVLSEIGLVYGIERNVFDYKISQASGSTYTANGDSAVSELVVPHVGTWISMVKQISAGAMISVNLNVGKTEPMFQPTT